MTVSVSTRLSQLYVGNNVNKRFDFVFRVFDQEDEDGVSVRLKNSKGFESIDKSLYTVTVNEDNLGGYVEFLTPPSVLSFFYVAGETPVDQLLDITNYDNFYPDAFERAFDKLTAILQEWSSRLTQETENRNLKDEELENFVKDYVTSTLSINSPEAITLVLADIVHTNVLGNEYNQQEFNEFLIELLNTRYPDINSFIDQSRAAFNSFQNETLESVNIAVEDAQRQVDNAISEIQPTVDAAVANTGNMIGVADLAALILITDKPNNQTAMLDSGDIYRFSKPDANAGSWIYTGLNYFNYVNNKVEFWQVDDNIQIQQFGPFSMYAAGFVGDNGKMPFGIEKDGTAVMDNLRTNNVSAEVLSVNDFQMPSFNAQPLDPISGYSWGVVGANNKMPLGIGNDGTIHAERIKVGSIAVKNANTFMYEKASQEWWIHPVHTYTEKPYPRVVSGTYGEDGSIIVGEYVIGQGITKNIIVGQTALIDDHNAPSVFIKENRRSVVMWQNHDKTQYLSAKVSTKDGDISTLEFADEQQIVAGVNISYTQLHHIESESTETEDIFYIFSRFAQTAWGFTKISVNQETGIITTLDQHNILTADAQYYMTSTLADNKLRIASYYNPAQALNQIHYWEIDIGTGDMTDHAGNVVGNIFSHASLPVDILTVTPVLAHNAAIDRRMFYVRSLPMSPAILYLEWTAGQLQNTGNYKVISLESDGGWKIRTYASSGKPFYSNYFDGASFPNPCLKDEIIVCRYDNANNQGVLERVINDNETMITIESARVDAEHLIRPMSPQNGGNLCAYVQLHAYATTSTFSFESDVNFMFLK